MNSKSEYARCRIPRLKIDKEGWKENNLPAPKKISTMENVKESGDEDNGNPRR